MRHTDDRWDSEKEACRLGATEEEIRASKGLHDREEDGKRRHPCSSGYWWENLPEGPYNEDGAKAAYPDCEPKQFRYRLGWYRAGNRDSLYRPSPEEQAGYDAFAARYPHMIRKSDNPWDDEEFLEARRKEHRVWWERQTGLKAKEQK